MNDVRTGTKIVFAFFFVLLLLPVVNWIVGGLIAGRLGVQLLFEGKIVRLLALLAGATVWSVLSFYFLGFPKQSNVAIVMMIAFLVWTWFMVKLVFALGVTDAPAQAAVSGRIRD